jgi:hypothetical protein
MTRPSTTTRTRSRFVAAVADAWADYRYANKRMAELQSSRYPRRSF